MLIHDTFATSIQKRIEPVVKVNDRRPGILLNELGNLVVTPQWERYFRTILDIYTDASHRDEEQSIGIWVSGFFGSGKSLMIKVLGVLLQNEQLEGQSPHDVFLTRLPTSSPDLASIKRYLTIARTKITTSVAGGNLHTLLGNSSDMLPLIVFKLFSIHRDFTQNWAFAWAIEYHIDGASKSAEFRRIVAEKSGKTWKNVAADPEFYLEMLYAAAAAVLPGNFSTPEAVERAVQLVQNNSITATMLIERLARWCVARDEGGRRHKLMIQLDELGQWIGGGSNSTARAQQVQALVETAATSGGGRIWIAVTAHGDVQALQSSMQHEDFAKINQRFASKCKLSNEDISQVVEERVLRKNQEGRKLLEASFMARPGEIADMGTLRAKRDYPAPTVHSFALFYPYMPWTVAIIPDVVKGIAQSVGREDALTGANRTMIGVVQGAIIETPGLLDGPVGRLLCLADIYEQMASDAPIETKTDLNRVRESVPESTAFTPRVARALYLLGKAEHVSTTIEHVALALVDSIDKDLGKLRTDVAAELERLVGAGFAKQVGDQYSFLSTQQRSFQDRVRARQQELQYKTNDLSQALKEYESDDALRFDTYSIHGRTIPLKLEIDNRVARNPTAHVTLRVYSPFQRTIDTQIASDEALRLRSNADPNTLLIRLDEVANLRTMLALAIATEQIATEVASAANSNESDKNVASHARQVDYGEHKAEVRRLLALAVRGATVFFRGTTYQPIPGEGAGAGIRAIVAQVMPQIYARMSDVPQRIHNEVSAVKAALNNTVSNTDLQNLGVYRSDGSLNDAHALLSTLRTKLPDDDQYQQFVDADALRIELERPPFGWDSHVVNVGLALLLRASACRLIDGGQTLTDPNDPKVFVVLTTVSRFKSLRVQGVRSELSAQELKEIRGYIEALFGVKTSLVAATMHNVLGTQLEETIRRVQALRTWSETARCPLPLIFDSGSSIVGELLNNATPQTRLPHFRDQAELLTEFINVLATIEDFRAHHAAPYLQIRDFVQGMQYADDRLPEVQRLVVDWRTLETERSITIPERWTEISRTYYTAQRAMDHQIIVWRTESADQMVSLEQGLDGRVRDVGVPEEHIPEAVATLSRLLDDVRARLAQPDLHYNDARAIRSAHAHAAILITQQLGVLELEYRPAPPPPTPTPTPKPGPVSTKSTMRVSLSALDDLPAQITTEAEVERVLDSLRTLLLNAIKRNQTIILE